MDFILKHGPENPRNSEGAFVKLSDGRILFAYTRYNDKDGYWRDHAPADIYAVTSADGGQTWSEPFPVVINDAVNVMSVSLLRLQDGRIALVYSRKSQIPGYSLMDCRPLIRFSSDEAQSWSEPTEIANVPFLYLVNRNDSLIQLRSGRLILPVSFHPYTSKQNGGQGIALYFLSDDGGASWRRSRECCYPHHSLSRGLMEPGVVELNDGRLLGWFRTRNGCQYKTFSYDQGETWSEAIPAPEFPSPSSPLALKRDPEDNALTAVWNDYSPIRSVRYAGGVIGRTPLVLARSLDEGQTWIDHKTLEDAPDHGFAYTAMLFEDRSLYLAYCCGGTDTCECMLQDLKIRKTELHDALPVSSASSMDSQLKAEEAQRECM